MLIDIHLLQNHAPSNLNRDDTGSPKDAVFGSVLRARISSQCLKRSIRRSDVFRESFAGDGLLSHRTRLLPTLVREGLIARKTDPQVVDAIVARIPEIGRESTKSRAGDDEADENGQHAQESEEATAQLIFFSDRELDALVLKLLSLFQEKGAKGFKSMKIDDITRELGPSVPRSVDIAMFGRMTTSRAFENVRAAVQVAHALSTHRVEQEFDYYTAVDDISGESGAGFIGDTEFNSATYYKYLSVHWETLVGNLANEEVARRAVQALVTAAAEVQPTGKQNSFAAHNLPDLVLVEVRERNVPVSYANAFLKPVRATGEHSLMDASAHALSSYIERVTSTFGLANRRAYIATLDYTLPESERLPSLTALVDWLPPGPRAEVMV